MKICEVMQRYVNICKIVAMLCKKVFFSNLYYTYTTRSGKVVQSLAKFLQFDNLSNTIMTKI